MGCGSSSQPAEDQKSLTTAGSKDTATADEVEPFNNSKTPSPKNKTKQKETVSDGPVPEPSAYVAAVDDESSMDRLSSIGTPFGGSPQSSLSQDVHEDNNRGLTLSPGYKMENETRKIGGFDPEAFRKANASNKPSNQAGSAGGDTAGDSWAAPVNNNYQQQQPQQGGYNTGGYNNTGGGNGGGYSNAFGTQNNHGGGNGGGFHNQGGMGNGYGDGNAGGGDRWGSSGQGDYIQSEDIFSSQSPQAMQNSSSMHFRDDPSNDPFSNSGDPFRSPGGMGHNPAQQQPRDKLITHEDDALMDDILGELDEF